MAVRGFVERLAQGPGLGRNPAIQAERERREQAHASAKSQGQLADLLVKRSRDAHHAAGGDYAAFRGKQVPSASTAPGMVDANGREADPMHGCDVLSEALKATKGTSP